MLFGKVTSWAWYRTMVRRPGLALALLVLACTDPQHPTPQRPVVDAGPDLRAATGQPVALDLAIHATPGITDPVVYRVDWGDGTSTTDSVLSSAMLRLTAEHTYTVDGSYAVRVTASDGAAEDGLDTLTAIVEPPGTPQVFVG